MARADETPSPDVTLATVERIEQLLRDADVPVSRNWLLARLAASGHATTRQRLNRALGYLFGHGLAIEGSKGVLWTHSGSPELAAAALTGPEFRF